MPHEIVNTIRAKSLVRIVGNSATLITLSDLAKDSRENVQQAMIAQASGVTDGVWRIYRGNNASGEKLLELPSFSHFVFYEFDASLANSSTSNVYITNSGTVGTLILQLAKVAKYDPPLEGM
jgi:hypothetical protein